MEFIHSEYPMPLIGIENRWSLYNVGFSIRNVSIQRSDKESSVLIHAYSNYLENPFHIFVRLQVSNRTEIDAKIWLENRHEKGFHDIYRDYGDATVVVPGIPWLPFLSPDTPGKRRILYPTSNGYLLTEVTERMMAGYRLVYEWEQPPIPGPVDLYFLCDPILPTTIEFLNQEWAFSSFVKSPIFPGILIPWKKLFGHHRP